MATRKKKATRRKAGRKKATKKRAPKAARALKSVRGRGKRLTPEDQRRREAMLKKHGNKTSPDRWTAQQCADALGLKVTTWNQWKQAQKKRKGGSVKRAGRRGPGRPRKSATASGSIADVLKGLQGLEKQNGELRRTLERIRDAIDKTL